MSPEAARILLVEDEPSLGLGIQENLAAEGYVADLVTNGSEGLSRLRSERYDLVVLDVMMPGLDGFSVCEAARREGHAVPILFLTAKGGVEDRIRGLEVGADDYLPKPFHLQELLLRVRALLRRGREEEDEVLRFGGNEVSLRTLAARGFDGRTHALTFREGRCLRALAVRPGRTVTREDLLEAAWGHEPLPGSRALDGAIQELRTRFEPDPDAPIYLRTVRGLGYRFTPEGTP